MKPQKRQQEPEPVRLPPIPAAYCESYQYRIDNHHVLTLWGKQGDTFHVAMSMHVNLFRHLNERVMHSIEEMKQRQKPKTDEQSPIGIAAPPTDAAVIKPVGEKPQEPEAPKEQQP